MSKIGLRSQRDFLSDFPIDLGKGIRADFVRRGNKIVGILLAHQLPDDYVCGTSVFWETVGAKPKLALVQIEPLSLKEDIRCSCGLHGWIREGQWAHAFDSRQ